MAVSTLTTCWNMVKPVGMPLLDTSVTQNTVHQIACGTVSCVWPSCQVERDPFLSSLRNKQSLLHVLTTGRQAGLVCHSFRDCAHSCGAKLSVWPELT